jgi:hypothetical protein
MTTSPRKHGGARGGPSSSRSRARLADVALAAAALGLVATLSCAGSNDVARNGPASAPPAPAPSASISVSQPAPAPSSSQAGQPSQPSQPAQPASSASLSSPSSPVAQGQRGQVVPPDLGDLEHMCALLTSCDKLHIPPALIPGDFSACVSKMASEMASPTAVGFSLMMRECGLQSNSCAALRSCALRGANPDTCAGRGKQSVVGFCDVDGRALACWHEQVLAVRDCPRGGEQCIVVDGQATCTLGPCPGDIHEGDKPRCAASGRHLLHCEKGKLASLDCAAFGLKCSTAADGTAGCATAGAACAATSKRCDGPVAVGCYNGHEVRVDCGAAAMTCASSAGNTPVGACFSPAPPLGEACDLSDRGKCDGASVKYCYDGRPRTYPCKALGFNRCESNPGGVHCAP